MSFYRWEGENLYLAVQVQPRSRRTEIVGIHAERLKIKITAPPVDGKANAEMVKFLAKLFKVAKSQVQLMSGETSREKRFCIKSPQQLPELINK